MGHDSKCTSLTSPNCAAAISFLTRLYLIYENGHMPCGSMEHSEESWWECTEGSEESI